MRAQSVVFASEYCDEQGLYFRGSQKCISDGNKINVPAGEKISTDTYFNLFDASTWLRNTGIKRWQLIIEFCGQGIIKLMYRNRDTVEEIEKYEVLSDVRTTITIPFTVSNPSGYYYFELSTKGGMEISDAGYDSLDGNESDIHLCVLTCTYRRKKQIEKNIRQLSTSKFFDEKSDLFGKMRIIVSDNGRELDEIDTEYIKIVGNENNGGSGGFTRCLREMRNCSYKEGITNVVFMDDDVDFLNESFYRMYALLALGGAIMSDTVIAGRMLRLDRRHVQYTACEIWNKGNIIHIGDGVNLLEDESLYEINNAAGAEYGGWWMCCYPYYFAVENDPLPFFIHCDDVEYGLRFAKEPIILNGIHVWHDTHENRQSREIVYYDVRNSMVVNAKYNLFDSAEDCKNYSMSRVIGYHIRGEYDKEDAARMAINDFLRGRDYFYKTANTKVNLPKDKRKTFARQRNYILQQLSKMCILLKYNKIKSNYERKFYD